jgi:tetratricopeptide (TPR) repeat protein
VPESKIANQFERDSERAPYVARDPDDELRRAIDRHPFVLLVGPSKSGKSRTALEALLHEESGLCHRPLIAPARPSENRRALRELTDLRDLLSQPDDPAILWLDDLDEYLRAGALTATLLRRWCFEEPRVKVLATIREGGLADLRGLESEQASPDAEAIGKTIGEVLDQAEQVHLARKPSHHELKRAKALYPGQNFEDGIGTSLIDAPRLVDRMRTGGARCPEGVAVVRAAVDWRRAAVTQRPSREDLHALFPVYFDRGRGQAGALERGIAWAEERLDSGAALLRRTQAETRYEAHDYVVEFLDGRALATDRREQIPRAVWDIVLQRVAKEDAVPIGYAAYTQPDAAVLDVAEKAWLMGAESADASSVSMAWFYLGALWTRKGQLEDAESAYRRAVGSGHPDAAPLAAVTLGVLLEGQPGREDEVEAAYRQAMASGHADAAPRAAAVLGLFLSGQPGREGEAAAAYEVAIASGHEGAAAMARKYASRLRESGRTRRGTART